MPRHGEGRSGFLSLEGERPLIHTAVEIFNHRAAAMLERASDVMSLLSHEGVLLYLNPTGRTMLGVRENEIGRARLSDLVLDPSAEEILSGVMERGEWRGRCRFRERRKGTSIGMETDAAALPRLSSSMGVEISVVARASQHTREPSEKERELRFQHQQSVIMTAVGNLASGVARDWDNLLTEISGLLDVLLDRDLEPALRAGAERTLNGCQRSSAMVHQLLALSRRQTLEPVTTSASHRVREMMALLRPLLAESIEVETELAPEPVLVQVDLAQLEQVLTNLVVNARDAMPLGGSLFVRTERVESIDLSAQVLEAGPGPHVRITVADTGDGMDRETLERVFEPFFTTKERGTGLGLATVYGIVKQSGGYVTVDSRPGEGATFSVYLPAVEGAPSDREDS